LFGDDESHFFYLKEGMDMREFLITILAVSSMAMAPKRPDLPDSGGSPNPPPTSPTIPETVQPIEARFKEVGQTYGALYTAKSITYSFRSFFGSTIGMCTYSSSGRNSVALSSSAWNSGSDAFREMLLFHELGHCLLGRGHKNTKHSDGRPESIMASSLFSQKTYLANRDQYLKELFTAESRQPVLMASRAKNFGECGFLKHRQPWEEPEE